MTKKELFKKISMILLLLSVSTMTTSCKPIDMLKGALEKLFKKKPSGGGGGGGGGIPNAQNVTDFLNNSLGAKERCLQLTVDPNIPVELPTPAITPRLGKWDISWSKHIEKKLEDPALQPLITTRQIPESDLAQLNCTGFKYATPDEKKKFYVVLMAAMAAAESDYRNLSPISNGATGLLQINSKSAKWAGCPNPSNMMNPYHNIECSLYILNNQFQKRGKLFNTGNGNRNKTYFWAVLEPYDAGMIRMKRTFLAHSSQLPFCRRTAMTQYTAETVEDCDNNETQEEKEQCVIKHNLKLSNDYSGDTSPKCSYIMDEKSLSLCLENAGLGEKRDNAGDFDRCIGIQNDTRRPKFPQDPLFPQGAGPRESKGETRN